jgi:hypothetical protein
MKLGIVVGACVLLIAALAPATRAALVLQSAQITNSYDRYSCSFGGFVQHDSGTTTDPFPNDAQNFAGVGPEGLRVLVNVMGSVGGSNSPTSHTREWRDYSFSVVFDIDQAYPFTFHKSYGTMFNDVPPYATLRREGDEPITLPVAGDLEGTLEPGRYTFSGATHFRESQPSLERQYSFTGAFKDTRLTVLPEPGALSLLALPLLWLRRRRG